MDETKNEIVPSPRKEITVNKNTKEEKLRQAPDEVLAMAIRDMLRKDKEKAGGKK